MITFPLLLVIGSWLSAPTWYTVLCIIGMFISLVQTITNIIQN